MARIKDLTGQRFSKLIAIRFVRKSKKGDIWLCKCDCGKEVEVLKYNLIYGNTKSCGCLRVESNLKHGLYKTRLYNIYRNMLGRCYVPSWVEYKNYGGRGIAMCDEWRNDISKFYNWAMANGYKDNLTIDRIDNNGNYQPSNCRWVTKKEQLNNTSRNKFCVVRGEKLTLAQIAEKYNINAGTLHKRQRLGKQGEDLIKPINKKYSHSKNNDKNP